MNFFSSFSSPFKPTNPVEAAKAKVESAQAALTKAKEEVTRLEGELNTATTELSQVKNTDPDGVPAGGRRRRTYRSKEKRPAKRRRNGRRSIRS